MNQAIKEISTLLSAELIENVHISTEGVSCVRIELKSGAILPYYGKAATEVAVYIFKNEFKRKDM